MSETVTTSKTSGSDGGTLGLLCPQWQGPVRPACMNWPPSTCSIGSATAVTSSSSSSRAETPPASVGVHDPGDPLTVDPLLVGDAVVELGGDPRHWAIQKRRYSRRAGPATRA